MNKNLYIEKIGKKAKIASQYLSDTNIERRNAVLKKFIQYIKKNSKLILNSNKRDIANAKSKNLKNIMIDRLRLDKKKITEIINSINEIIKFKDPIGKVLSTWKRPNGLIIKRVSIPIGVITEAIFFFITLLASSLKNRPDSIIFTSLFFLEAARKKHAQINS